LIGSLNLKKKVILFGWKNNLKDIYLHSKLFIIPSLYEGMPNSLIEAINFNIPCIGSNASGIEDLLLNGKGGFILKENNVESIYKGLVYSIKNYKIMLKKNNLAKSRLNRFHIKPAGEKYYKFILR
jgi:glycosyltransferase involved in cell wall biosynthesis